VQTNKVQKTHKGGRTMSWSILVVVGDGNGYVGAGIGKARAIPDAIRKAVEAARKNLVHVPMVGTTIPHDIRVRQNAAEVMLKPAAPGTGVVAGGSMRIILEAAGVKDVLAKSLGSANKVNTAWATLTALRQLKRASDVARLRGKNVNDLVPKSVALATMNAEQEDAAQGIASVVEDQSAELAGSQSGPSSPVEDVTAQAEPAEAAQVTQTETTSTGAPTAEGEA